MTSSRTLVLYICTRHVLKCFFFVLFGGASDDGKIDEDQQRSRQGSVGHAAAGPVITPGKSYQVAKHSIYTTVQTNLYSKLRTQIKTAIQRKKKACTIHVQKITAQGTVHYYAKEFLYDTLVQLAARCCYYCTRAVARSARTRLYSDDRSQNRVFSLVLVAKPGAKKGQLYRATNRLLN